jgi:hypothetical protein
MVHDARVGGDRNFYQNLYHFHPNESQRLRLHVYFMLIISRASQLTPMHFTRKVILLTSSECCEVPIFSSFGNDTDFKLEQINLCKLKTSRRDELFKRFPSRRSMCRFLRPSIISAPIYICHVLIIQGFKKNHLCVPALNALIIFYRSAQNDICFLSLRPFLGTRRKMYECAPFACPRQIKHILIL